MKVLLINPPFKPEKGKFSRTSRSPAIAKSGTLYYPFWLAMATGVLEKEGMDIKLIDAPAEGNQAEEIIGRLKRFQPQLVVVDTSTPSINSDVAFAQAIKEMIPRTFVILVGTHPSALPEAILSLASKVDAIALGEYDYTLRDLARALSQDRDIKEVAGLALNTSEGVYFTPQRPYIKNLDELPLLSWVYHRHLNYKNYFESMAKYPMVMIITGRGCPFHCFFCLYPQTFHGHHYRLHSPERVIEEFEYILTNFPDVKEIGIEDDTFTANLDRVKDICLLLIKHKLNKRVQWWANTRVNLDFETMKLMKEAGCRLIVPGFESGVQEILERMKKGITLEQSRQYVKDAKCASLLVHGCFVVGSPGETFETMKETLRFARSLDIDTAQFYPLIPYPGTEVYRWAEKNNYLRTTNFEKWLTEDGLHSTIIDTPQLSAKNLMTFCNKARRSFYMRPSYILKKIVQSFRDFEEGRRNFKAFLKFLPHLVNVKKEQTRNHG